MVCVSVYLCVWRSDSRLQELILSFYPMRPGDQTQLIRFDGKHIYPQSNLVGLLLSYYKIWVWATVGQWVKMLATKPDDPIPQDPHSRKKELTPAALTSTHAS